jgi:hypothetical protein
LGGVRLDSVKRSWFIAAIVIGIVSIAVAALIMRLTADDAQPTASEWAESVCTDLGTWRTSITSLADVGGGTLTPESLGDKLGEAKSATQTLVTELNDLGAPDLESGDQLKDELDSAANELESSFDTLKQGAQDAADASSPADFRQALAALAPQFQALLDTISTTVDDLQNANVGEDAKAELQQAFSEAASCQQLQADS